MPTELHHPTNRQPERLRVKRIIAWLGVGQQRLKQGHGTALLSGAGLQDRLQFTKGCAHGIGPYQDFWMILAIRTDPKVGCFARDVGGYAIKTITIIVIVRIVDTSSPERQWHCKRGWPPREPLHQQVFIAPRRAVLIGGVDLDDKIAICRPQMDGLMIDTGKLGNHLNRGDEIKLLNCVSNDGFEHVHEYIPFTHDA